MDYSFEEPTDIKLIIMKTVQYFKAAMPEDILTDVILSHGYANFFDFGQALFELTENRLLTYYEEKGIRLFSLTSVGETALEGFQLRIPSSVREKLYQSVRIKIREYENGLSLIADYEKTDGGDFTVRLGINEGGYEIFTLSLSMLDEKMAKRLCREFKKSPETLYSEILSVLIKDNS